MASKSDSTAGPSAFGIRLGISTGRQSPDPHTIMVNADTTVNWIFLQAAYVLSHIHGRSSAVLQADFDLVLLRPGRDNIVLNPSRVIADYNIGRNDDLQLRHKTLPIPVCVNLSLGDDHKIEVNSGFPLMDVIPAICQEIGIINFKELSLALPTSGPGGTTMQYEWLDVGSSLHGQGVQAGDTLLLRKKFYILNDDITEALEGNGILTDLIYQQIKEIYVTENYVGSNKENISACAKLSSLIHHIEQKDENISDEDSVCKVMPKLLQKDSEFYTKTVTTYYQERVGTLQVVEAKKLLLQFFSSSQSILVNYFPVKKFDNVLHPEELVLLVDSNQINVCRMMNDKKELKCVDGMSWRLRDLRDTECTTEKDRHLRLNILGSWYEFVTDHRTQISRYLVEARVLMKFRVSRSRVSVTPLQNISVLTEEETSTTSRDIETSGELDLSLSMNSNEMESKDMTEAMKEEPGTTNTNQVVDNSEMVANCDGKQESVIAQVSDYSEGNGRVRESEEMEVIPEEVEPEVKQEVEPEVKLKSLSGSEGASACAETADNVVADSFDLDDISNAMDKLSTGDTESSTSVTHGSPSQPSPLLSPAPEPTHAHTNGGSHLTTPTKPPTKAIEAASLCMEQPSPSKSVGARSSTSTYVHIPEFLGLDFREVLVDYKLFQIVVMKRDVRSILLNIKKPVKEVISSLCKTFDIPDTGICYLWIPTGIQRIIEKYGGRPKSRIGRFMKRQQVGGDFAPRLDSSKSLQDQYNFNIKPYLLHLRRYQSEEGVDGPDDEIDCGQEWPEYASPDVARYRKFYQSWTGVVQGIYPIERKGAVKLAALLTHVYYGDREEATTWPPYDYDAKIFLPETHKHSFSITYEVEKAHRELGGKMSTQDCINDVIHGCEQLSSMSGVFFEVAEPVKSDILKVIPWNRMEGRWFGISQNGIFSIDKETEEVNFTYDLTEISKWSSTDSSFKLTLRGREFDAYTYQAKEILDTLELFIQMRLRGEKKIAPDKPPQSPEAEVFTTPTKCGSPVNSSMNGSSQIKTPLNLELSRKQSILSPTTYDL